MDIGGTTFTSSLFDVKLKQLILSKESLVKDYNTRLKLISAFTNQIQEILYQKNINLNEVIGLSMSCPGPLDSKKGMILETPNLTRLQNTNLSDLMEQRLDIPVYIENDANLFVMGEWYKYYRKENVVVGITLGSGLGVGIVIDKRVYTGAHGMGGEYGISPFNKGVWEDEISIEGLEKLSEIEFPKVKSPKELFYMAEKGDSKAIKIWKEFGNNLGLFSSQIVNLLDPAAITIGGGLSKAFPYFNIQMVKILTKYCPAFNHHSINVSLSPNQLSSIHLGAALFAKQFI